VLVQWLHAVLVQWLHAVLVQWLHAVLATVLRLDMYIYSTREASCWIARMLAPTPTTLRLPA
jgi:hypothetical protein